MAKTACFAYPRSIHDHSFESQNVVDGSIGQCHGGPGSVPHWARPFSGFLGSANPVAIGAIGWRLIGARRQKVGLLTLAAEHREPGYVAAAAKLGLGVSDPILIEQLRSETHTLVYS